MPSHTITRDRHGDHLPLRSATAAAGISRASGITVPATYGNDAGRYHDPT
ncbi:hypothetical protein Lesp01_77740 [Lentzea sp. NBRC 102530]|nr:hypothetical protein Lesp01_77740 [Lentzea sp. NBRC 102530]